MVRRGLRPDSQRIVCASQKTVICAFERIVSSMIPFLSSMRAVRLITISLSVSTCAVTGPSPPGSRALVAADGFWDAAHRLASPEELA